VGGNELPPWRYDALLKRPNRDSAARARDRDETDKPQEIIVELLPAEQQARQEREERLLDQAQATKELIRNLAHEIKNPLGASGRRAVLEMENRFA